MPSEERHILYHITRILYPPLSEKYIKPAIRAVRLTRAGLGNQRVRLPSGKTVEANAFVEYLMLQHFVNK